VKKGRTIIEEIRRSETFGALNFECRDLFQGLIEVADDQGRQVGTATAVRSAVWAYDDIPAAQVQADLDTLASGADPFINIYKVEGKTYIQIINWWVYQQMQWAQESNYPAPEGWTDRWRYTGPGKKIITKNWDLAGGFSKEKNSVPDPVPASLPAGLPLPCYKDNDNDNDKNKEKDKDKEKENLKPVAQKTADLSSSELTLEKARSAWNYATGGLRSDGISKADFDAYVSNLAVSGVEGKTILVKAMNRYAVEFLIRRTIKAKLEQYLRGYLVDPTVILELWVDGLPEVVPKEPAVMGNGG
jgi:hypothetical protein